VSVCRSGALSSAVSRGRSGTPGDPICVIMCDQCVCRDKLMTKLVHGHGACGLTHANIRGPRPRVPRVNRAPPNDEKTDHREPRLGTCGPPPASLVRIDGMATESVRLAPRSRDQHHRITCTPLKSAAALGAARSTHASRRGGEGGGPREPGKPLARRHGRAVQELGVF